MDEAFWREDETSLVKNLKSICIVKLSFKNGIVSQVEANFSTVVGNNKKWWDFIHCTGSEQTCVCTDFIIQKKMVNGFGAAY